MRYTPEQKIEALKKIDSIGVAKTAEVMKISVQTLYQWRNKDKVSQSPESPQDDQNIPSARDILENDRLLLEKIDHLEAENNSLRAMLVKYRKALAAVLDGNT